MDVGNNIALQQESWSFADASGAFDQHIQRSIPNCQQQREYIATLARFFLHSQSRCYEIGVSTGALAEAVLARLPDRPVGYIGLDVEAEMVQQARQRISDPRFEALQANAVNYPFAPAQLVISYYTLQFIPLPQRELLLRRLYEILTPGGALILYEKTLAESPQMQDMLTQLYSDFKAGQGLSAAAILNKAVSLRGIAMPLSLAGNQALLQRCGFQNVELIYRAYCFAGYLAFKDA
jgi:tRNA (cmo5U34)-methyltransferase